MIRRRMNMMLIAGLLCLSMASFAAAQQSVGTPNGAYRPTIRSLNASVSAPDQYCALAAMKMYELGGNAIDAGIASTFVSKVTQHCHESWGGETPILIHHAATNKTTFVSGIGQAPKLATLEYFMGKYKAIPIDDSVDIAPVPGSFAGLALALEKYGTLTLKEVLGPAIKLAEEGFPLSPIQVKWLKQYESTYSKWADSKRIFMPDGKVPEVGQVFRQPELAQMMKALVKAEHNPQGRSEERRKKGIQAAVQYFYKGPVAKEIDRFMKALPDSGLLRYQDFVDFIDTMELEYEPLHSTYTDFKGNVYEIYATNTLTQAPALLMALNILDDYDIPALGHNSTPYLHLLMETIKVVMADRYKYFGDPAVVDVPEKGLVSKDYAVVRKSLIDLTKAAPHYEPGDPWAFQTSAVNHTKSDGTQAKSNAGSVENKINYVKRDSMPSDWETGTVQLATVDKKGNIFCTTTSNNMGIRVTGVVPGNVGFLLSGRLRMFYTDPNSANLLAPSKRPRITPCPVLVLKNGKPFMALGTPGEDSQIQTMLQQFLNIVEFDMPVQNAIEKPLARSSAFAASFYPGAVGDYQMGIGNLVPQSVIDGLQSLGHKVTPEDSWKEAFGGSCIITLDDKTGVISAGADPRRECYAVGF